MTHDYFQNILLQVQHGRMTEDQCLELKQACELAIKRFYAEECNGKV